MNNCPIKLLISDYSHLWQLLPPKLHGTLKNLNLFCYGRKKQMYIATQYMCTQNPSIISICSYQGWQWDGLNRLRYHMACIFSQWYSLLFVVTGWRAHPETAAAH